MKIAPHFCDGGNFSEVEHSRKTKHDISIFSFALPGLRKELMYNQ
ncbi:hypothetical protein CHCC14809_4239 [Bacillus licheniformis]|nr:hypothetical protein CHCC15292_3432 [Bacillus licheniformis]TWM14096.1 hypothetical protein CHCC15087_4522 [Bacillus licheniformis]TWM24333.1 hypothetical protein CHCC15075_4182 [Bacillus licheniformis]TWM54912.1 hypothetical protein CHCC14815_1995 [Bacillus licheniformis]TWM71053.1 hypothetical protein CHCC14809_4239 [Bacillus licheniformis]